jgi:tetratricopeptide (TPR) repeat protein
MMPEAQAPALAALKQAQALAGSASPKEQALIAALAARYSAEPPDPRAPLDAAYAQAMVTAAEKFPDDDDIATMAAEALMDTQPWDYWQAGGKEPKGSAAKIQKLLETVLARTPEHAGAIHLYIHLVEASDRPARAEPYADKLAALMPGAGHIVHMPSHIYYRVGRYIDSLKSNQDAEAVDEKYLAETGAVGLYPLGYYSHNIHFTLISAQLLGERDVVLASAEELDKHLSNEVATAVPIAQPIKAAPYFAWAQYGDPDKVLAMAQPAGAPPYVEAMWHYARGTALVAKKDLDGAKLEAAAIEALEKNSDWSTLDAWYIPAREVLKVAREVVLGRVAQAQGDLDGAIAQLEAAAKTQDTIPYMEPPFFYYPVRQTLGAALLQAGKTEKAIEAFNAALTKEANSPFALYGLMEAAKAKGDTAAASEAQAKVKATWKGDPAFLSLGRL